MSDYTSRITSWQVRVYLGNAGIVTWAIQDRTEQQADSEAMAEVARLYPGREWSMFEIEQQGE